LELYILPHVYFTALENDPPILIVKGRELLKESLNLEHIIRQCQQGNALAWESLVKSFQARVYSVSYYYMRNSAEAQESTQEVFIKVFKNLESIEGQAEAFLPWLLALTRNCCLDRLRKAKTRTKYEQAFKAEAPAAATVNGSPESHLGQAQRKELLYQALSEFSATNRDILLLKDIQGLKLEQVAEILSLPVGTVKSRSHRARIELAKRMAALTDTDSEWFEVN